MYHAVQYAMIIGEFLKMFLKILCHSALLLLTWHRKSKSWAFEQIRMSLLSSRGFSSTSKKTQMRKCRCIINPRSQNQAHGRQLPCPCLADPTEGSFTSYQTKQCYIQQANLLNAEGNSWKFIRYHSCIPLLVSQSRLIDSRSTVAPHFHAKSSVCHMCKVQIKSDKNDILHLSEISMNLVIPAEINPSDYMKTSISMSYYQ